MRKLVRDSMLAVSGKLDLTTGGPPVQMFVFKDDHSPVYDYARFDPDSPGAYRRSIYRFIVRSVPDPFMERLDCPDPSILTPKRSTTIDGHSGPRNMEQQFCSTHVRALRRTRAESSATARSQYVTAVRLALRTGRQRRSNSAYSNYAAATHGLANLARVLFNTNEFLFVD
jgi:hypothetical protein